MLKAVIGGPLVAAIKPSSRCSGANDVVRQPLPLPPCEVEEACRAWRERDLTLDTLPGQPTVPNSNLSADTVGRDSEPSARDAIPSS